MNMEINIRSIFPVRKMVFLLLVLMMLHLNSCRRVEDENSASPGPQCDRDTSGSGISISGMVKDGMTADNLSANILLYASNGAFCDNSTATASTEYSFSNLKSGTYTFQSTITDYQDISESKTITSSRSGLDLYSLKNVNSTDKITIILSWGNQASGAPKDLDSYISNSAGVTVYYGNKNSVSNNIWAYLDIDDTSYSGPETVTLNIPNGQLYDTNLTKVCYYTKIFTANSYWSSTKAEVSYWKNGVLTKSFSAPSTTDTSYKWWRLFDLDANLNMTTYDAALTSQPSCN